MGMDGHKQSGCLSDEGQVGGQKCGELCTAAQLSQLVLTTGAGFCSWWDGLPFSWRIQDLA